MSYYQAEAFRELVDSMIETANQESVNMMYNQEFVVFFIWFILVSLVAIEIAILIYIWRTLSRLKAVKARLQDSEYGDYQKFVNMRNNR